MNTHVGRETDDVMTEVARNQQWIDQASAVVRAKAKSKAGAKKIVEEAEKQGQNLRNKAEEQIKKLEEAGTPSAE